jgi:hypothetical protein
LIDDSAAAVSGGEMDAREEPVGLSRMERRLSSLATPST